MKSRSRRIALIVILLAISIGNFLRMPTAATIRTVDIVSLLAIGTLIGLLICISVSLKQKN